MTKTVQKASYWIHPKSEQGMHFTGQCDSNWSQCGKAASAGICSFELTCTPATRFKSMSFGPIHMQYHAKPTIKVQLDTCLYVLYDKAASLNEWCLKEKQWDMNQATQNEAICSFFFSKACMNQYEVSSLFVWFNKEKCWPSTSLTNSDTQPVIDQFS